MLNVTDDSGLLAVVVPATYQTFVSREWGFDQIISHFRQQMAQQSLLIWGTGTEGIWKLDVQFQQSSVHGFREATGPLRVVGGSVLVTNYESLTMAAQFEDVRLPEKHQTHLVVTLPDGNYSCRIIQKLDPELPQSADPSSPDFAVEFYRAKSLPESWSEIRWFSP